MKIKTILLGLGVALLAELASAQTTAFNFTGQLSDGGSPANGNYDFNFRIYSVSSGGSEVAPAISAPSTPVRNGVFSSMLDYGANVFTNGGNLWVQAEVRTAGSAGAFVALGRQQLTPVPFALYALKGVPGPQGPAGAPGAAGAPGPQGPPGTAETAGLTNYAKLNVPDTAAQAGAVPTVAGGFIVGVTVTNQGNGYVTNPVVNVTDATGSGAVLTPIVVSSKIVGITVSNPGSGYSANPTISISAPPRYTRQTFSSDNTFTGTTVFAGPVVGVVPAFSTPTAVAVETTYQANTAGFLWGTMNVENRVINGNWVSGAATISLGGSPAALGQYVCATGITPSTGSSHSVPVCVPIGKSMYYRVTGVNYSATLFFTPLTQN